jgi:hypothetical protein
MKKQELAKRIEELERRVRDLEARPFIVTAPAPYYWPVPTPVPSLTGDPFEPPYEVTCGGHIQ